MGGITLRSLNELGSIDRNKEYIGLHLSGLLGDTIHASCRFSYIRQKHPNIPWFIVHSYPIPGVYSERIIFAVNELLKTHFEEDRIAYYFYDDKGKGGSPYTHIGEIVNAYKFANIPEENIYECLFNHKRLPVMSPPDLGINIPNYRDKQKAVIFRRSAWHNHFPSRNRPEHEWLQIEEMLKDKGYEIHLFGHDDDMKTSSFVHDHRRKISVREVLEYSKDAGICITVATFFYQWTQHICPTFVLSSSGDCASLNSVWKLNENLNVINVDDSNYMQLLANQLPDSVLREYWISPDEKMVNGNRFHRMGGIWRLKLEPLND